jgi:hypothetical protein
MTASEIIDFFKERKGFSHWWDSIDDSIKEEILKELAQLLGGDIHTRE